MKKIVPVILIAFVILVGCHDKRVAVQWRDGNFAQAQQHSGNHDLMIFFETSW